MVYQDHLWASRLGLQMLGVEQNWVLYRWVPVSFIKESTGSLGSCTIPQPGVYVAGIYAIYSIHDAAFSTL